jgi:ATP-binding cassette subfamily F protein 3
MIEREERIAFVGKNGEGKSTLSKIIAGVEELSEGKLTIGYNVKIGYFAQNQAEILDGEKTVFQTIDDVAEGDVRKNVRSLLGSFLFGGDAVDKKVKVLSGGEKNRLALCKLLLQPYNLLIMDEPTNHLDMRSKEMLKNALMKYDGTLIVVSHDRDFLQGLTDKVYEFRNGNIKTHIGDLQAFLASRKIQNLAQLEVKAVANGVDKKEKEKEKFEAKHEQEEKKKLEKELKHAQNAVEKSEKEIERLEQKIKEMDDNLLDPVFYQEALKDNSVFDLYNELKASLEKELLLWEERQAVVERLQQVYSKS